MTMIIDRINQPSRMGIQKMNVPQAKKYTLDNGIEVYDRLLRIILRDR